MLFFMLEAGEKIDPISLKKIHFLVHPGYLGDADDTHEEPDLVQIGKNMRQIYINAARSMASDECLVLFTHGNKKKLKEDVHSQKEYTQTLHELRAILNKRLIVFSDNTNPDDPIFKDQLDKILQARGYEYQQNCPSEAFGEWFDACVANYASRINTTLGLNKKSQIIASKSAVDPKDKMDNLLREVLTRYQNVEIQLNGKIMSADNLEK